MASKTTQKRTEADEATQIVQVDKYNLDGEWTDQPGAMHWCLLGCADALRKRKEAEEAVELILAEQDETIRTHALATGEKITENAIKRQVVMSTEYQDAVAHRDDLALALHVLDAERTALDHKKSALETLGKLYLANYYSEPSKGEDKPKADQGRDADEQREALVKKRHKPQRLK